MGRASTAVAWNMLRVLGQSVFGIVVSIILARLLDPDLFGLMMVALIFVGLSEQILSVALSTAVIQRKELTQTHKNVAFTMALILATAVAYVVLYFAAHVAEFFGDARAEDVIQAMVLGMWFNTASSVHRGLIMREMDFKKLTQIDFSTYFFGYALISPVLAFLDFGIWALVIGNLVWSVSASVWVMKTEWFGMQFSLSSSERKQLYHFSLGMSLINILNFLQHKATDTFIGRFLGMEVLGLFSRAAQLASLPFMKIATTISAVMFSAYSELQNDIPRLYQQYIKAIKLVSATSLPILAGMWACSDYVIVGMYGEKWREAISAFEALCIAAVIINVMHLNGAVIQATNNIYREVWRQAVFVVSSVTAMWFVADYGLMAIIWAGISATILLYLMLAHLVIDITDSSWSEFFMAQMPGVVVSVPIVSIDIWVKGLLEQHAQLSNEVMLLALVATSGFVYLSCILFLPDKWVGGLRAWVCEAYGHKLPSKALRLLSLRS